MSTPDSTSTAFQREFLTIRGRLLDLAAALDRVERADGVVAGDARREAIRRSLEVLASAGADRAERIQLLFSLPYEENWQTTQDS
jgi:hypothetical protein